MEHTSEKHGLIMSIMIILVRVFYECDHGCYALYNRSIKILKSIIQNYS